MTADRNLLPWPARLRNAAPYAAVLAAGLWLYTIADRFQFERDPGRIGPDAWPKLILILMTICALWGLGASLGSRSAPAAPPEKSADEAQTSSPEIYPWRVWIGIGITFAYLLLLPRIGFLLATALYATALIRLGYDDDWKRIALVGIALSLFFLFLFMRVVYVALPMGEGPFAQLSLAAAAAMGVR